MAPGFSEGGLVSFPGVPGFEYVFGRVVNFGNGVRWWMLDGYHQGRWYSVRCEDAPDNDWGVMLLELTRPQDWVVAQ